ncbi:Lyso-phosphatidylcholine acyltransferase [Dispira simplex]|nr:Lyso-phosphatidylcholine acyltransferase [Dispira simplex]
MPPNLTQTWEEKGVAKTPLTYQDHVLAARLTHVHQKLSTPDFTQVVHLIWHLCSTLSLLMWAVITKTFLNVFTSTEIINGDCLVDLLDDRLANPRPMITVSNHRSPVDDPALWGFLPFRLLFNRHNIRWGLAAKEILFNNSLTTLAFTLGQTIPLVRGGTLYQPFMDLAIDRLNDNKWVHIFPEGKIHQGPGFAFFRWGVARLVMEAKTLPLVVPIWHTGFDKIFPFQKFPVPRLGHKVKIIVGEPLDFFPLFQQAQAEGWSPATFRTQIILNIEAAVRILAKQHGTFS